MSNIYNIINSLLECLPILFLFTNLLPFPISSRQKLIFYTFQVLMHLTVFRTFSQLSAPVFLISSLLLIVLFDRKHKFPNLLFALIGYIYGVCLDFIVLATLGIFDLSIAEIRSEHAILFCSLFSIFVWLATYYPGKILRKKILSLHLDISPKLLWPLFLEAIICCAVFLLNIIVCESLGYPFVSILWNSILFVILFICTTFIFVKIIKMTKEKVLTQAKAEELESLKYYIAQIESLYENINQIHHDYPNILISLRGFIEEENISALNDYFFTKILPFNKKLTSMDSVLKQLTNIKYIELKSILYSKLVVAQNQSIAISLMVPETVGNNQIHMDSLDLVRVMGIFLDNAIEATVEASTPQLDISILVINNGIKITIANSCSTPDIPLGHIYNLGISSKGSDRGIGLHSANAIINHYSNILHNTKIEKSYFIQELIILEYFG